MREFSGTLLDLFLFVIGAGLECMTGHAAASLSMGAGQSDEAQLQSISFAQPGVTTISGQAEEVWHTAAAVFMLTHDETPRSGAVGIRRSDSVEWGWSH